VTTKRAYVYISAEFESDVAQAAEPQLKFNVSVHGARGLD